MSSKINEIKKFEFLALVPSETSHDKMVQKNFISSVKHDVVDSESKSAFAAKFKIDDKVMKHRGHDDYVKNTIENKVEMKIAKISDEVHEKAFKSGFEQGYQAGLDKGFKEINEKLSHEFDGIVEFLKKIKKSEELISEKSINLQVDIIKSVLEWFLFKQVDSDYIVRALMKAMDKVSGERQLKIIVDDQTYRELNNNSLWMGYIANKKLDIDIVVDSDLENPGFLVYWSTGVYKNTSQDRHHIINELMNSVDIEKASE